MYKFDGVTGSVRISVLGTSSPYSVCLGFGVFFFNSFFLRLSLSHSMSLSVLSVVFVYNILGRICIICSLQRAGYVQLFFHGQKTRIRRRYSTPRGVSIFIIFSTEKNTEKTRSLSSENSICRRRSFINIVDTCEGKTGSNTQKIIMIMVGPNIIIS